MASDTIWYGPGRDELNALHYYRERGLLEIEVETACAKQNGVEAWGSKMYEGNCVSWRIKKVVWRNRKRGCNDFRSLRSKNAFFYYEANDGKFHSRLPLHTI